jgi:hypothetical protein
MSDSTVYAVQRADHSAKGFSGVTLWDTIALFAREEDARRYYEAIVSKLAEPGEDYKPDDLRVQAMAVYTSAADAPEYLTDEALDT